MTKRIFTLVLVSIMLLGLVACATDPIEPPVAEPADSQTDASQQGGETPTPEDTGKGETPESSRPRKDGPGGN